MSEYNPHRWLVIKLTTSGVTHYRVFASWYGGYTGSDSWKMNSGIVSVTEDDDFYFFTGSSGSVYNCNKQSQGISGYGSGVLNDFIKHAVDQGTVIEILPEDVNLMELVYE